VLKYIAKSRDAWFARYDELANWALAADVDEYSYRGRFFGEAPAAPRAKARVSMR
jgi:hypothetical protein